MKSSFRNLWLFLVVLTITITSCGGQSEKSTSVGTFKNIKVSDVKTLQEQIPNLTVIDIRTPEEIASGKMEGALTIDFRSPDFSQKISSLDRNTPALVYCASGGRSSRAMEIMKQQGFKEVYNLDGGFKAWTNAGMPVSK